jgi:hypothetical protein
LRHYRQLMLPLAAGCHCHRVFEFRFGFAISPFAAATPTFSIGFLSNSFHFDTIFRHSRHFAFIISFRHYAAFIMRCHAASFSFHADISFRFHYFIFIIFAADIIFAIATY